MHDGVNGRHSIVIGHTSFALLVRSLRPPLPSSLQVEVNYHRVRLSEVSFPSPVLTMDYGVPFSPATRPSRARDCRAAARTLASGSVSLRRCSRSRAWRLSRQRPALDFSAGGCAPPFPFEFPVATSAWR